MQAAFKECHGLQCGFCTPGMVMSAIDLVRTASRSRPKQTIREQLDGNLCRCTGYHNIVKAVQAGASRRRWQADGERTHGRQRPHVRLIGAIASRRKEDYRFLTGAGPVHRRRRRSPHQAYAYFLRSPHAHAKIRSIDTGEGEGRARRRRDLHRRRSRRGVGRPALRLADHQHRRQADERAAASGPRAGQGAPRRRPGRARRRRVDRAGEGRGRADRRRLRRAAGRGQRASTR